MTRGGRNLTILGVGAISLAVLTTSVSLAIYRDSGDIYLDRSRPGYLPDEEEITEESDAESSFSFSETGELTKSELEEYLKELKKINSRLEKSDDVYAPTPLSDQSLGIPSELKEE